MCGRFTLRTSAARIAEQFSVLGVAEFAARFNVAPSQPVAVIRAVRGATPPRREMVYLRWGLVPAWANDPAVGNRLINARAESAAEKPAFRTAMRRRRCLVLADGFYEWQQSDRSATAEPEAPPPTAAKGGKRRPAGRTKQPYFLHLRGHQPFAFAGLWEAWQTPDHSTLETCTILTTAANELVRPLHDRMPVILSPAVYAAWLDPAVEDPRPLLPLLAPYPSEAMEATAVGNLVNSPAHQSPQCIEPLSQKGNITLPGM